MKKATLTRKSVIYENPLYDVVSFFGFGSKISIAIFSATQNSIWMRFSDFKQFWKFTIFVLLSGISCDIFIVFCIDNPCIFWFFINIISAKIDHFWRKIMIFPWKLCDFTISNITYFLLIFTTFEVTGISKKW